MSLVDFITLALPASVGLDSGRGVLFGLGKCVLVVDILLFQCYNYSGLLRQSIHSANEGQNSCPPFVVFLHILYVYVCTQLKLKATPYYKISYLRWD